MKKGAVLVLHRKSANRPEVKQAVKAVQHSCVDLEVRVPWNKKDKRVVVRELLKKGYRRIVAGGGDGTLNGVANAILSSKHGAHAEMGILPLGTANDLAHGLGLPCEDLTECLTIACKREARPIDLGIMNGKYFINVASGGYGAEVTATTPQEIKQKLGGAAYTLNGLVKLWNMRPYRGTLTISGGPPQEGSILLMAVGNSRLAGGGFEVAPMARPDDGLLDLMVILDVGLIDSAMILEEILDPLNPLNKVVRYWQAEQFTIHAERPLHINLDGEPILADQLDFSVAPGALRVVY